MHSDALQLEFAIVDVFTHTRYEGNPLAIVRIPRSCNLSQDQKQKIAREFNLSETTFLHEQEPGRLEWKVDIFTTDEELPFAGHPTIGTACHVLATGLGGESGSIEALFQLKAGPVRLQYDAARGNASATIPHNVHIHSRQFSRHELLKAQSHLTDPHIAGQIKLGDGFPIVSIVKGMTFVLIELEDLDALGRVAVSGSGPSKADLDRGWNESFLGMYFWVRTGTNADGATTLRTRMIERTLEDPATGSAASGLAAYLSLTEKKQEAVCDYAITQGVEMGRRSDINLRVVKGGPGVERIILGGSAIPVMQGRLTVEN